MVKNIIDYGIGTMDHLLIMSEKTAKYMATMEMQRRRNKIGPADLILTFRKIMRCIIRSIFWCAILALKRCVFIASFKKLLSGVSVF